MRIQRDSTTNRSAHGKAALTVRDRVLEAACESFAESGFHGTHLRDICKRAGTNVAGVCYHFQSKEGLYQAVMMEAGRQLSDAGRKFPVSSTLAPEQKLFALVESLLRRLASNKAWIAKLLARELVDRTGTDYNPTASHLEQDTIQIQAVMRSLPGVDRASKTLQLHAITLVADCVFYTLAAENPLHPLSQFAPTQIRGIAQFLAQRAIEALKGAPAREEVSLS